MSLFTIERNFGDDATDTQLESAGFRAKICALYFPGMRWWRSFRYVGTGYTRCFYDAASDYDLKSHALASVVPCDAVRPVTEVVVAAGESTERALKGAPVRDPEGVMPLWVSRHRLDGKLEAYSAAMAERVNLSGPGWVLGYLDAEVDEIFSVFLAPSQEDADGLSTVDGLTRIELVEVMEAVPADIPAGDSTVIEPRAISRGRIPSP